MGSTESRPTQRSPDGRQRSRSGGKRLDALAAALYKSHASVRSDAPCRPSADCLPDEALHAILDCIERHDELFNLRLVSKRWNALVIKRFLRESRHPRSVGEGPWPSVLPILLSVLPDLPKVDVGASLPLYKALHNGNCTVGTLKSVLDFEGEGSAEYATLLQYALLKRAKTLQAFDLLVIRRKVRTGGVERILKAIDTLEALKKLSIDLVGVPTGFKFRSLATLEMLRLSGVIDTQMAGTLIACNRSTLQVVYLARCDDRLTDALLTCRNLRSVYLFASAGLPRLKSLPQLQQVHVLCASKQDLQWLRAYLDCASLPRELAASLTLCGRSFVEDLVPALGCLGKVHELRAVLKPCFHPEHQLESHEPRLTARFVVDCLSRLRALRVLRLVVAEGIFNRDPEAPGRPLWGGIAELWTPLCAPTLRRLEVGPGCRGPWEAGLRQLYDADLLEIVERPAYYAFDP